jgi:hypothetical protein
MYSEISYIMHYKLVIDALLAYFPHPIFYFAAQYIGIGKLDISIGHRYWYRPSVSVLVLATLDIGCIGIGQISAKRHIDWPE